MYITLLWILLVAAITLYCSCIIVNQQSAALIERLGRFARVANPGINFKIPFFETISGWVNLRVSQLEVVVDTKTQDNVFVKVIIAVQYQILADRVYDAFYTLDNPEKQIKAFVFDVVRARVPTMNLDDLFSRKDDIANAVKEELHELMNNFGHNIIKALVTDIDPDATVKAAMNEINANQRLKLAAAERGEADKIIKIKQAEAEAESKVLQGKGTSGQRKAIIDGLKDSLNEFKGLNDVKMQDIMNLVMMSQYFDTIKELSCNSKTNTILLPHSPRSVHDLQEQILNSIMNGIEIQRAEDDDDSFNTRH